MTRDTLEHSQIPIYFVAVLLAAAFGLLAPSLAHGLGLLVTPAIAVLMYAMFLQIPFLELRQGLGNQRFLAALLLANFILVPMLVWLLTRGLVARPALLVGALLVLLTPCIDYVVVFTHIGKGDSRLMLAATPVLLLLQLVLLPVYLGLILGGQRLEQCLGLVAGAGDGSGAVCGDRLANHLGGARYRPAAAGDSGLRRLHAVGAIDGDVRRATVRAASGHGAGGNVQCVDA